MASGRRRELAELLALVKLLLSYKKRFMLGLELWKARYGKLRPRFMNTDFWLVRGSSRQSAVCEQQKALRKRSTPGFPRGDLLEGRGWQASQRH